LKLFDIEAEYSVLGTMIMQPSFVYRGVELLKPEEFFKQEHKVLFKFIRDLVAEGYTESQLNEISFVDELKKKNLLEKVGGEEHVALLVEYALENPEKFESACKIVKDKALLRQIVEIAREINEKVEETPDPDLLLDSLEKRIFSLSEERITNTLVPVSEVIPSVIQKIEEIVNRDEAITGISTGFYEIDKMTSGLQPSDLIILAARPSMGKTAFSLSIAYNVGLKEGKTVAFFSLEMSKEQLITRLIAQDSGIPLHKIRDGYLRPDELKRVIESADRLSQSSIFIDDTPGISILEMRAKARRLKSEKGLDLIIVDYLQLMRGIKRTESRQQEVSEISRSLKALAKELNVPVIALSQLSRQVEHRADKRPQLSDLRESGCLTGDTLIIDAETGKLIPIKELVGKEFTTVALDRDLKLKTFHVSRVFPTGRKKTYILKTRSGREIKATANHPFLKLSGWTPLERLKAGDKIAVPSFYDFDHKKAGLSPLEVILLAHLIGDGSILPQQPYRYTSKDMENIRVVKRAAEKLFGIKPRVKKEKSYYNLFLPSPYRLTRGKRHPITLWFERLGIERKRAPEKELPSAVFSLDRKKLALLIRHLWATDGCIKATEKRISIYYASTSKKLINQLQHLLLRLGILSRIHSAKKKGYRETYHLYIVDKLSMLRFLREVGAFGLRKRKEAQRALELLEGRSYNPNIDALPREIWKAVERAGVSWRELSSKIETAYCGSTLTKSGVSRKRLRRIAKALESSLLEQFAASHVLWDEVVEIKELGVEEVYDMTVPGAHNFVANDIIVHNSIEQDADIVMFIHRPEVYKKNPEPEEEGIAEIIIAKQRNGPTGTVRLAFIKELTRFENTEEAPQKEEEKEVAVAGAPSETPSTPPPPEEDETFTFDDEEDYNFDF
jgi:replicative DNA helicase